MIAIEIEAPIVNHRIDFSSELLPSNIVQAKIIVLYEEPTVPATSADVLALARAARASFPKCDLNKLHGEFAVVRSEWETRGHMK
ncbi:hypothetical protein [Propionivibrio sp.]|uniref:hypothetical protein n=1 Tax=Propionivibrio sp. TaxID=2212460 RepID=UPI003BF3077C